MERDKSTRAEDPSEATRRTLPESGERRGSSVYSPDFVFKFYVKIIVTNTKRIRV